LYFCLYRKFYQKHSTAIYQKHIYPNILVEFLLDPIYVDPQEKIRHHLNALFGAYFILPESTSFSYSRRTGRIKSFSFDNKLAGTLRPDGGIALTLSGAKILMKNQLFKTNCVIPMQEAVPFVSEGRSLFCKHVKWCGSNVKTGSDVVVIDDKENILAVGRARFASDIMKGFDSGVAVKVRQGIKSGTSTEELYDARRKPRNETYVRQDGARDERNGRN
jgi:conserved protein with predicted RNA binding PUA domain